MAWSHGKAYGQDLRDRVFSLSDSGLRVGQVARQLVVSVSYVSKVLGRKRRTGEVSARPQRCHMPLKLAAQHDAIAAQVASKPDTTVDELRQWLLATHKVTASKGLMVKTLAALNLTHKKRLSMPRSNNGRTLRKPAMSGERPYPSLTSAN